MGLTGLGFRGLGFRGCWCLGFVLSDHCIGARASERFYRVLRIACFSRLQKGCCGLHQCFVCACIGAISFDISRVSIWLLRSDGSTSDLTDPKQHPHK